MTNAIKIRKISDQLADIIPNFDKCCECGKWFHATNKNSVDIKILGLYGTAHKECAEKLLKEKKAMVIHQEGAK